MTTKTVDTSSLTGKTLVGSGGSSVYAKYELLVPNVATLAADSVATVTVTGAGTGYVGIPTPVFTGGGGFGVVAFASVKALTGTVVVAGSAASVADNLTAVGGTFTTPAVYQVTNVQIVNINNTAGGSGYVVNDQIVLNNVGGTQTVKPIIVVDQVTSGQVTSWHITNGGLFTVKATSFTQFSTTGSGTGVTFNTPLWGAATVGVLTPGQYSVLPTAPIATSGGGGGMVTLTPTYGVDIVTVTNGGQDFTSAPSVSFTGGSGSGATATSALATVGDSITVSLSFTPPLPTATYQVMGCASQASSISTSNKTISGATVTLTPLNGAALIAGTMDLSVNYYA